MAWTAGKQVKNGTYTIEDVLGQGRFGITYFARKRDGAPVVIKTPNKDALIPEEFERLQQVFVKEAQKLARCHHPHIVQVFELFEEDGVWCIPMEYIDGITLDRRSQERRQLPEAEALTYIHQIGEALGVVHRNKLLHRDVRPANIMVRAGKTEAVLIDFGLAQAFDQDGTRTLTKEIAKGFAPIEFYYHNSDRGPFSEVYSLSATLYELLTGEILPDAVVRVNTPKLIPPRQHNPLISDTVNKAILRGLAMEKEKRPQTVKEWLTSLALPELPNDSLKTVSPPTVINTSGDTSKLRENMVAVATVIGSIAAVISLLFAIPQCQRPQAESETEPSTSVSPSSTP